MLVFGPRETPQTSAFPFRGCPHLLCDAEQALLSWGPVAPPSAGVRVSADSVRDVCGAASIRSGVPNNSIPRYGPTGFLTEKLWPQGATSNVSVI